MTYTEKAIKKGPPTAACFRYFKLGDYYINGDVKFVIRILRCFAHNGNYNIGCQSFHIGRKRIVRDLLKCIVLTRKDNVKVLPIYGDLVIPVQGGLKLFDIENRKVTKYAVSLSDRTDLEQEYKKALNAAQTNFAPVIVDSDIHQGWYSEALVQGACPHKWSPQKAEQYVERNYRDIARLACKVAIVGAPKEVLVETYVKKLVKRIDELCANKAELEWFYRDLENFKGEAVDHLGTYSNSKISICFSHGDFSLVNFIDNNGEIVVLDWESCGYRSSTNDVCNFAITEQYYGRSKEGDLTLLHLLLKEYDANLDEERKHSKKLELVLGLYYLERLEVLLNRSMSQTLNRVLKKSLNLFQRIGFPSDTRTA